MSVKHRFNKASKPSQNARTARKQRPSPFCIRLSEDQRNRLMVEAAGIPLGTYVKAKALGDQPIRARRTGISVEDRSALAKALALLGKSRLSSNLNQLAHAANIGSLPMTPETEDFLQRSLLDIRDIRQLLIQALGMKPERQR